jgi:ATP-dependent DNA ligase
MKLDGSRALARRQGAEVELLSRRGRIMNEQFPEIVARLRKVVAFNR